MNSRSHSRARRTAALRAVLLLSFLLVPSLIKAEAQNPWKPLENFSLVPGSELQIEERYVVAAYRNSDAKLNAFVIFNATCDRDAECTAHHPAAYAILDREGNVVRSYVDPGEQELMKLIYEKEFI